MIIVGDGAVVDVITGWEGGGEEGGVEELVWRCYLGLLGVRRGGGEGGGGGSVGRRVRVCGSLVGGDA